MKYSLHAALSNSRYDVATVQSKVLHMGVGVCVCVCAGCLSETVMEEFPMKEFPMTNQIIQHLWQWRFKF